MRREATDAADVKFLQTFHQFQIRGVRFGGKLMPLAEFRQFDDGQLEDCAHGVAHGAAQEWAAGSFADDQRLNAKGDAVAHERAEIFRAGQCVHSHEEPGLPALGQDVVERGGWGNFPDGELALIHGKADEGFQQFFIRQINGEFFRARFEQRAKRLQMFFGQQNGDDFKTAFQQPAHDLFALGDKDALPFMLQRPPHRAIRREFRQVERGDFLDVKHELVD